MFPEQITRGVQLFSNPKKKNLTQWSSHGQKISGCSQKFSRGIVKKIVEPVEKLVDACSQITLLAAVNCFLI